MENQHVFKVAILYVGVSMGAGGGGEGGCVYGCVNEVCMVVTGYIDGCAGVGVGVY